MQLLSRLLCVLMMWGLASTANALTVVVLLGTGGGPGYLRTRAQPSSVVLVDGTTYLVDCGNGAGEQLRAAGFFPRGIDHIFITHHHSDHVADCFNLSLLTWDARESVITLHGPKPLKKSVKGGYRQFKFDLKIREVDEGHEPLKKLTEVHQFKDDGIVLEDGATTVTAARVDHVPIREAYAYRFDTPDVSVVFSGDTAPSQGLIALAQGADVLVHEVLMQSGEELSQVFGLPVSDPSIQHIVNSHTHYSDLGEIAAAAGVGTLVLYHFVLADVAFDETAVRAAIAQSFSGEVVFGVDGMRFQYPPIP